MEKSLIYKIKSKALNDNIPIILDDTLQVVEHIFRCNNINDILEIGTAVGYSAICFSQFIKSNGYIDTIEKDENRVKEARGNIESIGLQEKVNIIAGDAVEILPTINKQYDLIFIDAAKGKYPEFLKQAIRLVKNNGIILADNVLYKGYVLGDYNKHKQRTAVRRLREFLEQIEQNPILQSEILQVGDGLAVIKKINKF